MFVESAVATSSNRLFRYEVIGLKQNNETDKSSHAIRHSGSVFVTVPYNRLNVELQKISRLGGKVVGLHPVNNAVDHE
jgi:hypothetical protein